jgi:tetratricopeptide (TPR) repeat protein
MSRRSTIFSFIVVFFFAVTSSFAQHRPGGQPPSGSTGSGSRGNIGSMGGPSGTAPQKAQLMIRVVFPNDHPAGENISVELDAATGSIVGQSFTNLEGQVTFQGIAPGSYVVKLRGADVKETSSGMISIEPYDTYHTEFIHVQPLNAGGATAVKSTQGAISAAELNVPDKARKQFEKGNEAAAKGDSKKASEFYQKAIELYPKYAMAYNNLGVIYMKANDKVQARAAWNKALEVDPNSATANANVARLDLLENNYASAIPALERALAVQPNAGEILLLMSEAQFLAGHFDQALLYARKTQGIDQQKYAMARIIAGRSLEAQNHPDLARVEYEVLLKEAPSAPEAAEARKSIARLDGVSKK